MSIGIQVNTPSGLQEVITKQGLSATGFICDSTGKLEPTVRHDATITGNGSTANPLTVNPFTVQGDIGTNQQIVPGDTLIFDGIGIVQTEGVTTDTVAIRITPGTSGQVVTTDGLGNVVWQTPVNVFSSITWDDATNSLVLTPISGPVVTVPVVDTIANFLHTYSLAGDTGTTQTITNGDTVTIAGGQSISTVAGATDTVTVNLDLSTDAGQNATIGTDGNILVTFAVTDVCSYFTGSPV